MYVRRKTVKGLDYYYLVKSVREGKRVKQVYLAYLGSELPSDRELERIKAGVKDQ